MAVRGLGCPTENRRLNLTPQPHNCDTTMDQPKQPVTLTRQALYDLVWATPIDRLATDYGISGRGLQNICRVSASLSTIGAPPIAAAWSIPAIATASIYRSSTSSALPRPGSSHRSAASATAMTTPWPKPSTAFTRPRSSTDEAPGDPLKPSNMRRWNGWTGSTTGDCSSRSGIPTAEAEERYYAMRDDIQAAA
jgi:hypothetical protein